MERVSSRVVHRNPWMVVRPDMTHRACTDDEITDMIRTGRIVDAPSLAALTLYRLTGKSK